LIGADSATCHRYRADDATRIILASLSRFLAAVNCCSSGKPETLIRWHRQGFRLVWRRRSLARGRPAISPDVQRLIATMAANWTWGKERIASELLLKRGIGLSPRTLLRYMPSWPRRPKAGDASLERIRAKSRPVGPRE
jgi:hypothetical protein